MGFFKRKESEGKPAGPTVDNRETYRPPKDTNPAAALLIYAGGITDIPGVKVLEFERTVDNSRGKVRVQMLSEEDGKSVISHIVTIPWTNETFQQMVLWASIVRGSPEFETTRMRLLSAYDPPEEILYYLSTSPDTLFQLSSLYNEKNPSKDAELCVGLVKKYFSKELDFSTDSLKAIVSIIEQQFRKGKSVPALLPTIKVIGSYVGEVIRKDLGGEWKSPTEEQKRLLGDHPVVHIPKGEGPTVNPIGKVGKFFREGPSQSVFALWASTRQHAS